MFILVKLRDLQCLIGDTACSDREKDRADLQSQIDQLARDSAAERDQIRKELQKEREEREKEAKEMQEHFR